MAQANQYYYQGIEVVPETAEQKANNAPQLVIEPGKEAAVPPVVAGSWIRRHGKLLLIAAAVATVVVVGVAVGCGVGLTRKSSHAVAHGANASNSTSSPQTTSTAPTATPTSNSSAPAFESACSGTLCTQILAASAVRLSDAAADNTLLVFARGLDNAMYYATASFTDLATAWPDSPTWTNMNGGTFRSQPGATSWNEGQVVAVAALADPSGIVHIRMYDGNTGAWNSSWEGLYDAMTSPVTLGTVTGGDIEAFAVENDAVVRNYWNDTAHDFITITNAWGWLGTAAYTSTIAGRPAFASLGEAVPRSLLAYNTNGSVAFSLQNTASATSWSWGTPYNPFPQTAFRGDPVVLATSATRLDFFGIGADDAALYHAAWTNGTAFAPLDHLGGAFASVPAAVATGDGNRIDVAALGTNGTLLHRVWTASADAWSDAWEDLGVEGNSAPLLTNLTTADADERVALFVLGTDGQLNASIWTVSDTESWQGLSWASMGGNLTSTFFTT